MPVALYYLHDPYAPDPNCPVRFGSAVMIMAKGKILLEQRSDNYKWGIVSGDIHNNETFRDCAIRQTSKETDITLCDDDLTHSYIFDDPSRIVSFPDGNIYRIVSVGYFAELDEIPEVHIGKGSSDICWVDPEELSDYNLMVIHKEIIKHYLKTVKGLDLDSEDE